MKLLDLLLNPKKQKRPKSPPPKVRVTVRMAEPEPERYDIELNEYGDYRRSDDPSHVIRVDQERPPGYPKKLHEYIKVAGVSHRQSAVIAFIAGHDRHLSLRREPVPEHPKAIAVYGDWLDVDEDGRHEALLGYVPRDISESIANDRPVAATLEAMFAPDEIRSAGLRINIWSTRDKRAS